MIQKQPNSHLCFICGLENPFGLHLHFYDNGDDEVWADVTIGQNHQGFPGVAHGGVVAAILDEAGGRVMMTRNGQRMGMTAKLDVRYRQPVPLDTPLRVVGRRIKDRGRLVSAHAELRTPAGQVLAEAEVLSAEIDLTQLAMDDLDRAGWRVYPDSGPAA
ncbi:MAG: PaaI family thioesterase [Anaerolineales bacterium]|nr:PaaI family thioesterase [Anaerolineales bacterium]